MKNKYKLEVYKDRKKEWRWHIKRCGRIIAESGEGYKRKGTMMRVFHRMIENIYCELYGLPF